MWRDPRYEESNLIHISCPSCDAFYENINFESLPRSVFRKCEICNKGQKRFICELCEYHIWISSCNCIHYSSLKKSEKESNKKSDDACKNSILQNILDLNFRKTSYLVLIFMIISVLWYFFAPSEAGNAVLIENLKKDYPSQKNETWYHFMGILEEEIPSVKSIILLHGKDKKTSDCLAKELVFLYTKNKNLKNEEITFSNFKADDYGFILEHYHKIVKKYRVFITDLNKVSGNVARIFHSLCDEISSDIKPSLFIFTLKYEGRTERLRPIERATSLLRKTWNDLRENELSPLLSRVVKNVVDIVPEHQIIC